MNNLLPSFFIIGERKCGTSSLYRYLVAHPHVLPCKVKEPDFFSKPLWKLIKNFSKYKKLFPTINNQGSLEFQWPELDENGVLYTETVSVEREEGVQYITGEASVNTFYYANPFYIKKFLPNVKIILMLREPAERTFSHYRMLERFKKEGRKTMPLDEFTTDMRREMAKVKRGGESLVLSPSIYTNKLPKWMKNFGKENFLVLKSEELADKETAGKVMKDIINYLGIEDFDLSEMLDKRFNVAPSKSMPEDIKEELKLFFEPYNKNLEGLIGRKMY
jgi:hypothetical protein